MYDEGATAQVGVAPLAGAAAVGNWYAVYNAVAVLLICRLEP